MCDKFINGIIANQLFLLLSSISGEVPADERSTGCGGVGTMQKV